MITFLLGLTLGIIVGAAGLVCIAIMYDKHHPDEQKGKVNGSFKIGFYDRSSNLYLVPYMAQIRVDDLR